MEYSNDHHTQQHNHELHKQEQAKVEFQYSFLGTNPTTTTTVLQINNNWNPSFI